MTWVKVPPLAGKTWLNSCRKIKKKKKTALFSSFVHVVTYKLNFSLEN